MTAEKKPEAITRRDFLKGIAVGAVVTGAVATGVAAVTWPAAPPAPAVTVTTTAPPVTTTVTAPAPPPEVVPAYTKTITLSVNGVAYTLQVETNWTLLHVLREKLGLTGAKRGCDRGECGACTVLVDGKPIYSCTKLAVGSEKQDILTIEGLSKKPWLHPIQQAFVDEDGMECGYCTPGLVMSAKGLLDRNPNPTEEEVREALAGNLCRCGSYPKIIKSVLTAAVRLRGG